MPLRSLAARVLAKILESHAAHGQAVASAGEVEVVIIVRERRHDNEDLKTHHKRLLGQLDGEPRTAKTLCRMAGYSASSISTVRQGLADLVRMGRAQRTPDGYVSTKV